MFRRLTVIVSAVVLTAFSTTTIALATENTGPEDAVAAFHAALADGDRAALLELLAPDVVIFESGGSERSRAEYASHHLASDMQFSRAVERNILAQQSANSGDAAWVATRSRMTGTFRDQQIDLNGTETMILHRTAEGWRITHIHWSSKAAKR